MQLQSAFPRFEKQAVKLAAISYDSEEILKYFAERHKINYPLLGDPNSKIIEALTGELIVSGGTVANSSSGLVLVSGSAATLFIESGTIAGGKVQSLAGAQISAGAGNNVLSGVTIASGTLVQDTGG